MIATPQFRQIKLLAAFSLLWEQGDAIAKPVAAATSSATQVTEVVATAMVNGTSITETFTPTSFEASGLTPPITVATTITSVNSSGETVAVAIAAGAGVVAGGALAAWLFRPVPGAPPAPTSPPPYETSGHTVEQPSDDPPSTTSSTTSVAPACPFQPRDYSISFTSVPDQPQWTMMIPSLSTSTMVPQCTQQGSDSQLIRGTDPGYINSLAAIFCKSDLSKDQSTTLGQSDLPDNNNWKTTKLDGIRVKFGFQFGRADDACQQNCIDSYNSITKMCEYDSHTLYGNASLVQGCGKYSLAIDADPLVKLECAQTPDPIWNEYMYRPAALDAVDDFCTAHDGAVLKRDDPSTTIRETTFSISFIDNCSGSKTYSVGRKNCINYLTQTLDDCDTSTTMYKHGGILTDLDNCVAFGFHPAGHDVFKCAPDNSALIPGTAVAISSKIAQDAVNRFCDRKGQNEYYTLDPAKVPASNSFTQDVCKAQGFAACSYYYTSDGQFVTQTGAVGNFGVNLEAKFHDGDNCPPDQKYEIHGDRCHAMLNKLLGVEPKGTKCAQDPNNLKLGSFQEYSDKGCVLWNFWAFATG